MSGIKNILAATDFSEHSAQADARAAMLCAELQCDMLELLTVKDPRLPEALGSVQNIAPAQAQAALVERAKHQLQQISARLQQEYGVRCALCVRFGNPAAAITCRADELAADLTVVGSHGGNFVSDVFLGNTTDKLVRTSRRPVLVIKNEPGRAYREVLVPVDFSDDSKFAARMAMTIAPAAGVVFLHVVDEWFEGPMQYANIAEELIEQYRVKAGQDASREMERFIAGLGAGDRPLSRVLKFGRPAAAVREYAETARPDLIVIGKQGESRVEEVLFGSVTRDTIEHASSDVLIATASWETHGIHR